MSDVVRLRAPRWRWLPRYAVQFLAVGLVTVNIWWNPGSEPSPWWLRVAWGFLVLLSVLLVGLGVFRPEGVDLRRDVAVIVLTIPLRFGTREVAWRDVQAVTVEGGTVVLHRSVGKPVQLPYPSRGWLVSQRQFEADYHRVGRWWLAHRGTDWRPVPPPNPSPTYPPVAPPPLWPPPGPPRSIEDVWRTPPHA